MTKFKLLLDLSKKKVSHYRSERLFSFLLVIFLDLRKNEFSISVLSISIYRSFRLFFSSPLSTYSLPLISCFHSRLNLTVRHVCLSIQFDNFLDVCFSLSISLGLLNCSFFTFLFGTFPKSDIFWKPSVSLSFVWIVSVRFIFVGKCFRIGDFGFSFSLSGYEEAQALISLSFSLCLRLSWSEMFTIEFYRA